MLSAEPKQASAAPSEMARCKLLGWLSKEGSVVLRAWCPSPCLFPTGVGSCRGCADLAPNAEHQQGEK